MFVFRYDCAARGAGGGIGGMGVELSPSDPAEHLGVAAMMITKEIIDHSILNLRFSFAVNFLQ